MKHARKKRKSRPTNKKPVRRNTLHGSTRRSKGVQPTNRKVTTVVARMRKEGTSLRTAARDAKVSPRTVIKKAASALRKNKSGRYKAKTSDRIVRLLMIPTPQGPKEIEVRGLRDASRLGRYWVAVDNYYERGDTSVKKFEGQSITAVDGTKYLLITDLHVLNQLGYAGVLSFESLYARGA